jgi:hypothetical protein
VRGNIPFNSRVAPLLCLDYDVDNGLIEVGASGVVLGDDFLGLLAIALQDITPESPRYYVLKGDRQKAKEVIAKYHTTSTDLNLKGIFPRTL